uniref:Uncharacterized protein n=1 Tax=Hyaloperonospora arabidopsidis (strain Emoy2) TaxID=559515 RepID=M4BZ60_HYAAE
MLTSGAVMSIPKKKAPVRIWRHCREVSVFSDVSVEWFTTAQVSTLANVDFAIVLEDLRPRWIWLKSDATIPAVAATHQRYRHYNSL